MREGSEGRLHSKVCGRLARFMGSWVHGFMGTWGSCDVRDPLEVLNLAAGASDDDPRLGEAANERARLRFLGEKKETAIRRISDGGHQINHPAHQTRTLDCSLVTTILMAND
jgi:hypothetical protein